MHPLYAVDPSNPAFNPLTWYNLVGAAGCVFWVAAYALIVQQCFRERIYGLPLVAICLNFGWELLASFVFPNPVLLWHIFDRLWLAIDVVIVYQLLRFGRDRIVRPQIKTHFYSVVAATFVIGLIGQYTFVASYQDRLGLVGAFGVNLIMSILFVFFLFDREPARLGISRGGAVCKMLGTIGTAIECHFVVRAINPELSSLGFLYFLTITIFFVDLLYVGLVFARPSVSFGLKAEPIRSG